MGRPSWSGLGAVVVLVSLVVLVLVVVVANAERTSTSAASAASAASASRELLQGKARKGLRVWYEGRETLSQQEDPEEKSLSQQEDPEEVLATIWKIYDYLLDQQIEFGTPFLPPLSEQKLKGLFPSYVHLNFHGDELQKDLRDLVKFFDNNMFVTDWILQILLEFISYGIEQPSAQAGLRAPEADDKVLDLVNQAMTTLMEFKDQNRPEGVPIFSFWKQILKNGTWIAYPTNIATPLKGEDDLATAIYKLLETIGMEKWAQDMYQLFVAMPDELLSAFMIPSDTDDSSCNLALGAWTEGVKSTFGDAYASWTATNVNFTALGEAIVEYSYEPFSSDPNKNTIDPRTFYWMRNFIYEEQNSSIANNTTPDLRIVTTWLQNIAEIRAEQGSGASGMPFNVNNVDVTVCANTIYGLARAYYAEYTQTTPDWFSEDLFKVYKDTAKLIAWSIDNQVLVERPDIALLYYPPTYDFYWFVSRSVFFLNYISEQGHPLPSEFQTAMNDLTSAMRGAGTQQILAVAQYNASNGWAYWDDFVGDNDTVDGQTVVRGDDRIFSTSIATNALLDSWTYQVDASAVGRCWVPSVPQEVQSTVDQAVSFLLAQIFSNELQKENAFFSGSMKGESTFPFAYPANFIQYLNGTNLTDPYYAPMSAITTTLISAVSGVIPEEEYEQMIPELHFGMFPTPTTFPGFNAPGNSFPYWSAPPLTYASTMLALSKYYLLSLPSPNDCTMTTTAN